MKSFFNNLDSSLESAMLLKNNDLYNLCKDVKSYVQEGNFTNYKKVHEILSFWGTTDDYASKMLGMKSSSIRVTRRNLSNELYTIMGYDFFTLLNAGDKSSLKQCMCRLDLVKKYVCAKDLLFEDAISEILSQSRNMDTFPIQECRNEMEFLNKYSKKSFLTDLVVLDKDKLAYLVRMLNRVEGTAINTYHLISYLTRD